MAKMGKRKFAAATFLNGSGLLSCHVYPVPHKPIRNYVIERQKEGSPAHIWESLIVGDARDCPLD